MRRSSRLAVPMRRPEDVIPYLGKPYHWKQGRSAKALADAWFGADDLLLAVRLILDRSKQFPSAELLDGWLERETDLGDGRATPSQTDLLALIGIGERLAVLGVEAKVDESFGKPVTEWMGEDAPGKRRRLQSLCDLLGLDVDAVGHLRYQLLHRTAAAILEARRFRTDYAVLLVHSFCPRATGLADCAAFFAALGLPSFTAGELAGGLRLAGVEFWAGWVADTPLPETVPGQIEVASA